MSSFGFLGLKDDQMEFMDYVYPLVTVVIPTYNNSQSMTVTLEKVLEQVYPEFEVVIVDAGSTDRTLEVVNGFFDKRVRVCTVADFERFEMFNKGISLSKGSYIHFLMPGEFYLSENSLKKAMQAVLGADKPDFFYGASLLRHAHKEPDVYIHDFSIEKLKKGLEPTILRSCFFKRELFKEIGKFRRVYENRADFDLFCRISIESKMKVVKSTRVLTDADYVQIRQNILLSRYKEMIKILITNYGVLAGLNYILMRSDLSRYFKKVKSSIKGAFTGR